MCRRSQTRTASGGRASGERLLKERIAHTNRIKALLFGQGIRDVMPLKPGFIDSLEQMRSADGRRLPPHLMEEIVREHERLCLVGKQLAGVEAKSRADLRAPARARRRPRSPSSSISRASV